MTTHAQADTVDPRDHVLRIKLIDLKRVAEGDVADDSHERQSLRALEEFLEAANISVDDELTLVRRGEQIVVSRSESAARTTTEADAREPSFERCLADVLARRDSALRRLAE